MIDDVKESELNPTLKVWRILPTLYNAREREDNLTLEELTAKYHNMIDPIVKTTEG
jgi:hypothetical protein